MAFPSEVAISSMQLLTVYKNTWLQEAAPLESIIRHRNLDTRGNPWGLLCQPTGIEGVKNNEIFFSKMECFSEGYNTSIALISLPSPVFSWPMGTFLTVYNYFFLQYYHLNCKLTRNPQWGAILFLCFENSSSLMVGTPSSPLQVSCFRNFLSIKCNSIKVYLEAKPQGSSVSG